MLATGEHLVSLIDSVIVFAVITGAYFIIKRCGAMDKNEEN